VNRFESKIAADHRKRRPKPHATWHLDEVYPQGRWPIVYLWRAVDAEGEVLDALVRQDEQAGGPDTHAQVAKEIWLCPSAASELGIVKRHERVDAATIERRVRIRCKGSRAWDSRKDLAVPATQILSTSTPSHLGKERTELQGIAMQTWREVVAAA